MRAMVLHQIHTPLKFEELAVPEPSDGQLQVRVIACGVCRTDLHILDGELLTPQLPLILGHQIVGVVEKLGPNVQGFKIGDRVGIPWLGGTCQECKYCRAGKENLCDNALFTGYKVNGGFADFCVARAQFCFHLSDEYTPVNTAPLLCGGLIGFRAYKMTQGVEKIGFYGFGSSAHILIQIAKYEGRKVYAFTREGDIEGQKFAKELGAVWAGSSLEKPPEPLDAAIIFATDGALVPQALECVDKGGKVICAGIHMSDIPSFPYAILWGERSLQSVANLTRKDGEDFLTLAAKVPMKTQVTVFPLPQANEALDALRAAKIHGSAVIDMRL